MVKGKRQRANVKSPKTNSPESMTNVPNTMKDYPVRTLNNYDVNQLKELVGLSNNIIKLMQQCIETDRNIAKGNSTAKDMLQGKIKGPAMQEITPRLYLPVTDMKDIAKKIKNEVATLKQINAISKSQLTQQYNAYIDAMRKVKDSFEQLLVDAPKQEKKVIFEKDIAKLTKKDAEFLKGIKATIDKKAKK